MSSFKFYGPGARCLVNKFLLWVINDALLVHLAPVEREDLLVVDDDCLDDLVDISLVRDLVTVGWNRQKRWSEADGQVIGVHHVLIRVLRQTRTKEVSTECKVQHKWSKVNSVAMHTLMLASLYQPQSFNTLQLYHYCKPTFIQDYFL